MSIAEIIKLVYRHIEGVLAGGITRSVNEGLTLESWEKHLFGLSPERFALLDGKVFWITGAGSGFGKSIAVALAASGSAVILSGRNEKKLGQCSEEIHQSLTVIRHKPQILPFDITKDEDCADACRKLEAISPRLDGIVHCAAISAKPDGIELSYPLSEAPVEIWDRTLSTNVRAPWLLTRSAFPIMTKGGGAKVIFLTSHAGWVSTPGKGIYNVSKAALNSLCHSMAKEYEARYPNIDIQINAVDPGEARTEMNPSSQTSPFSVVSIVLALLSHPPGGPNGRFFSRNGRHIKFGDTKPYDRPIM